MRSVAQVARTGLELWYRAGALLGLRTGSEPSLRSLPAIPHFRYKGNKENSPSWKLRLWQENHSWQREVYERRCRDGKGHPWTFPRFNYQGHTRLISTLTCYTPQRSWQWNLSAEPRGTPGPYVTKLQLPTNLQMMPGTEASPSERKPEHELSPSAFQMALHTSIRNVQEVLSSLEPRETFSFFLGRLLPLSLFP